MDAFHDLQKSVHNAHMLSAWFCKIAIIQKYAMYVYHILNEQIRYIYSYLEMQARSMHSNYSLVCYDAAVLTMHTLHEVQY